MKALLIFLSIALVFSSDLFLPKVTLLQFPTPDNLKDFIIGNLVSLKVLDSVPDGFSCATNLATLKNNTLTSLKLFLEGHFVDALHLLEQTVNGTLTSCLAASAEGKATFENFLRIVLDPEFLPTAIARIRDNQLSILEDLALGFEQLNNQSFFSAGMTLGKIPHLVLSGPDNVAILNFLVGDTNSTNPMFDFVRGFLEAVKVMDGVPDALPCMNDIATLKDLFPQVLDLIKQFKIIEAIELLQQTVLQDVTTCHNSVTETTQLFQQFLQNIGQPGFFDIAKGRIFDNLLTLTEDLETGISSLAAKDFYGAGKALGHINHVILSGPDA